MSSTDPGDAVLTPRQKLVELYAGDSTRKASVHPEATSIVVPLSDSTSAPDPVVFIFSGVRDVDGMEIWIPERTVRRTGHQTLLTRMGWLAEFGSELLALRPQLGKHVAASVALLSFRALGGCCDARKAALEYHMRQESGARTEASPVHPSPATRVAPAKRSGSR